MIEVCNRTMRGTFATSLPNWEEKWEGFSEAPESHWRANQIPLPSSTTTTLTYTPHTTAPGPGITHQTIQQKWRYPPLDNVSQWTKQDLAQRLCEGGDRGSQFQCTIIRLVLNLGDIKFCSTLPPYATLTKIFPDGQQGSSVTTCTNLTTCWIVTSTRSPLYDMRSTKPYC